MNDYCLSRWLYCCLSNSVKQIIEVHTLNIEWNLLDIVKGNITQF